MYCLFCNNNILHCSIKAAVSLFFYWLHCLCHFINVHAILSVCSVLLLQYITVNNILLIILYYCSFRIAACIMLLIIPNYCLFHLAYLCCSTLELGQLTCLHAAWLFILVIQFRVNIFRMFCWYFRTSAISCTNMVESVIERI